MNRKVLIIDGFTMLYQSRVGWVNDAYKNGHRGVPLSTVFLRVLKSNIMKQSPSHVFFVIEGFAKWRYDIFSDYKLQRHQNKASDPYRDEFVRDRDICINLLQNLGINVVQNENFEGDDMIYFLCKLLSSVSEEIVVISVDKDLVQLYDYFDNVKVYDQVRKKYREPEDNFVKIRAFLGDKSDEIPQVLRGLGQVTATKIINENRFDAWAEANPDAYQDYKRNVELMDLRNAEKKIGDLKEFIRNSIRWGQLTSTGFKAQLLKYNIYNFMRRYEFLNYIEAFQQIFNNK